MEDNNSLQQQHMQLGRRPHHSHQTFELLGLPLESFSKSNMNGSDSSGPLATSNSRGVTKNAETVTQNEKIKNDDDAAGVNLTDGAANDDQNVIFHPACATSSTHDSNTFGSGRPDSSEAPPSLSRRRTAPYNTTRGKGKQTKRQHVAEMDAMNSQTVRYNNLVDGAFECNDTSRSRNESQLTQEEVSMTRLHLAPPLDSPSRMQGTHEDGVVDVFASLDATEVETEGNRSPSSPGLAQPPLLQISNPGPASTHTSLSTSTTSVMMKRQRPPPILLTSGDTIDAGAPTARPTTLPMMPEQGSSARSVTVGAVFPSLDTSRSLPIATPRAPDFQYSTEDQYNEQGATGPRRENSSTDRGANSTVESPCVMLQSAHVYRSEDTVGRPKSPTSGHNEVCAARSRTVQPVDRGGLPTSAVGTPEKNNTKHNNSNTSNSSSGSDFIVTTLKFDRPLMGTDSGEGTTAGGVDGTLSGCYSPFSLSMNRGRRGRGGHGAFDDFDDFECVDTPLSPVPRSTAPPFDVVTETHGRHTRASSFASFQDVHSGASFPVSSGCTFATLRPASLANDAAVTAPLRAMDSEAKTRYRENIKRRAHHRIHAGSIVAGHNHSACSTSPSPSCNMPSYPGSFAHRRTVSDTSFQKRQQTFSRQSFVIDGKGENSPHWGFATVPTGDISPVTLHGSRASYGGSLSSRSGAVAAPFHAHLPYRTLDLSSSRLHNDSNDASGFDRDASPSCASAQPLLSQQQQQRDHHQHQGQLALCRDESGTVASRVESVSHNTAANLSHSPAAEQSKAQTHFPSSDDFNHNASAFLYCQPHPHDTPLHHDMVGSGRAMPPHSVLESTAIVSHLQFPPHPHSCEKSLPSFNTPREEEIPGSRSSVCAYRRTSSRNNTCTSTAATAATSLHECQHGACGDGSSSFYPNESTACSWNAYHTHQTSTGDLEHSAMQPGDARPRTDEASASDEGSDETRSDDVYELWQYRLALAEQHRKKLHHPQLLPLSGHTNMTGQRSTQEDYVLVEEDIAVRLPGPWEGTKHGEEENEEVDDVAEQKTPRDNRSCSGTGAETVTTGRVDCADRTKHFCCVGVFDGHCGDSISAMATRRFAEHFEVAYHQYATKAMTGANGAAGADGFSSHRLLSASLVQTLLHLDLTMYDTFKNTSCEAGSTACVAAWERKHCTVSCPADLPLPPLALPESSGSSLSQRLAQAAAAAAAATAVPPSTSSRKEEHAEENWREGVDYYAVSIASLGDSRAIVGSIPFCRMLLQTTDHRISSYPSEKGRIVAAGGSVDLDRVDGTLDVTRGLGDYRLKVPPQQWWVGTPGEDDAADEEPCSPCLVNHYQNSLTANAISNIADVSEVVVTDGSFLLIASDGLWDRVSSEEALQFVAEELRELFLSPEELSANADGVAEEAPQPTAGRKRDVSVSSGNTTADSPDPASSAVDTSAAASTPNKSTQQTEKFEYSKSALDDAQYSASQPSQHKRRRMEGSPSQAYPPRPSASSAGGVSSVGATATEYTEPSWRQLSTSVATTTHARPSFGAPEPSAVTPAAQRHAPSHVTVSTPPLAPRGAQLHPSSTQVCHPGAGFVLPCASLAGSGESPSRRSSSGSPSVQPRATSSSTQPRLRNVELTFSTPRVTDAFDAAAHETDGSTPLGPNAEAAAVAHAVRRTAQKLATFAINERHSSDNVSLMLVVFRYGEAVSSGTDGSNQWATASFNELRAQMNMYTP